MSTEEATRRITFGDDFPTIIHKLSEGNIGAISCLMQLSAERDTFDLCDEVGILNVFLAIDTAQLYGWRLYVLWNYLCDRDMLKTYTVLRAYRMGIITAERLLIEAKEDRSGSLDHETLLTEVKKRHPSFGIRLK